MGIKRYQLSKAQRSRIALLVPPLHGFVHLAAAMIWLR